MSRFEVCNLISSDNDFFWSFWLQAGLLVGDKFCKMDDSEIMLQEDH